MHLSIYLLTENSVKNRGRKPRFWISDRLSFVLIIHLYTEISVQSLVGYIDFYSIFRVISN